MSDLIICKSLNIWINQQCLKTPAIKSINLPIWSLNFKDFIQSKRQINSIFHLESPTPFLANERVEERIWSRGESTCRRPRPLRNVSQILCICYSLKCKRGKPKARAVLPLSHITPCILLEIPPANISMD